MNGADQPRRDDNEAELLRQTARDLIAISTLPAVWNQLDPRGVADSLASVMLTTLDLDYALVLLADDGEHAPLQAARGCRPERAGAFLAASRTLLDSPEAQAAGAILLLSDPADGRTVHGSVARLGIGADLGRIVAVSARADFPTQHERVLLSVLANQAAGVLHRQLAELALKRSERRFLDFAGMAPAILWATEADGSCSFLSRAWYEFTGQREDQDEGLGLGWLAAVHPDDRPAAGQAFMRANTEMTAFSLEHRLRHAEGSYRWVIDAGRPRFSAAGAFLGFVGNVLDISERKHAEQALQTTRNTLAAVFDALPVGVAVADRDGKVLLSNREMQRYLPTNILPSQDDARADRWRAFDAHGQALAREHFAGARALRGERVVPGIEALYRQDDGTELWTQVAAVPLPGPDGAPDGQVSVVMDIDAFKRTEAALRTSEASQRTLFEELTRAHRNLSEFLAVLAHELRNPLAPIVTGLELMGMRAHSSETVLSVRGVIERQVKQLSHLIDDLLDIARVTNGKVELKPQPFDLRTIVSNAVETSLPLIEKARHAFSMQVDEAALPVLADPTRIAQVIGNLLTNAAKYTPHGGSIHLALERQGDEAVLSIRDNGVGIPAESLDTVFDMFSQVGRNMAHSHGGLGIGLALVRQLVALHGGSVRAFSAGPGQGSTFVVRLPLDLAQAAAGAQAAAADAPAQASLRILVTDDNVDAATTLVSLLELFGHELRIAHDGEQALRIAGQFAPQVAFLDIGLPGMNGYELAARLRRLPGMQDCTIVAVSGWGTQDDLRRASEAGFDRHFTKPVAAAQLSALLDGLR